MFKKATTKKVSPECECLKLMAMLKLRETNNASLAKECGVDREVIVAQAKKVFGDK